MRPSELATDDILIIVAENLTKLREFQSLSQTKMAERIGTNQAGYCLTEKGIRELNFTNLYWLAVEFGVDLNALFGLSDARVNPVALDKHEENIKFKARRKFRIKSKKK